MALFFHHPLQRIELYQWWGFQLSNAQKGAKIIPITEKAKSSS